MDVLFDKKIVMNRFKEITFNDYNVIDYCIRKNDQLHTNMKHIYTKDKHKH